MGKGLQDNAGFAELYAVETSQFKKVTRRDIDRFSEDFMFELIKSDHLIGHPIDTLTKHLLLCTLRCT